MKERKILHKLYRSKQKKYITSGRLAGGLKIPELLFCWEDWNGIIWFWLFRGGVAAFAFLLPSTGIGGRGLLGGGGSGTTKKIISKFY